MGRRFLGKKWGGQLRQTEWSWSAPAVHDYWRVRPDTAARPNSKSHATTQLAQDRAMLAHGDPLVGRNSVSVWHMSERQGFPGGREPG